ncbi:hypothetical protein [Halorubrum sp. CBA1229]|uniref:hypothetical protein n=1 Tax=Halorubrum sp. CBA1229 TaxID=1853699 RepID=UPI000F3DA680|nr:hypothetical protein [Halorubrum sp. CBA1229]QKY16409.1 hypothetical protein Hrr1229_005775 [Halorubrum sp. CBA1229]
MFGGMQEAALKQMMEKEITAYAATLAAMERDQREAMRTLAEAADADPDTLGLDEPPADEERVSQLVDAIVAQQTGDLWGLYVDHVAPEELTNADRAEQFADVEADEWAAQIETWAEKYRDRAGDAVADQTDREIADTHTRETFGLGLDEFEAEVVDRDPARLLQSLVAGPIETHTDAIRTLAEREE